jgi:hypothetical protein
MLFVSLNNIMKGFTYGAGTANPSGALALNPPFWTDNTMAKRFQRGNQKKMEKQRSTKHNTEN